MVFNFSNFYCLTEANFTTCPLPETPPDFWSYSGSTYWDMGDRVIRWSTHWGRGIASCNWFLDQTELSSDSTCYCGECFYKDFASRT